MAEKSNLPPVDKHWWTDSQVRISIHEYEHIRQITLCQTHQLTVPTSRPSFAVGQNRFRETATILKSRAHHRAMSKDDNHTLVPRCPFFEHSIVTYRMELEGLIAPLQRILAPG